MERSQSKELKDRREPTLNERRESAEIVESTQKKLKMQSGEYYDLYRDVVTDIKDNKV